MKLEIGHTPHFSIREENLTLSHSGTATVMHISDLHLNKYSEEKVNRIIACVESKSPSVILLGGDYVDTNKGMQYFEKLINYLSAYRVIAIPGNHDYFFGIDKIKKIIQNNNLTWIEKGEVSFAINGTSFLVTNNPIKEEKEEEISILLVHKPSEVKSISANFDMAFAGHLHGSQVVFWQREQSLFPGRFFYKYNRLKMKTKNLTLFISKGLGDTLPIRYNCTKEIIIVNINPIQ